MIVQYDVFRDRLHTIPDEARDVFLIAFLHYNKIISDESMKAMLCKRNGRPKNKYRNTYHCKWNDKWYNKMNTRDILRDVLNQRDGNGMRKEMHIEDMLKYIKLQTNGNRNYCVNIFRSYFVTPLISQFKLNFPKDDQVVQVINTFGIPFEKSKIDTIDYAAHWCCIDCHGSKYDWISERRKPRVDAYIEYLSKRFLEELDGFKNKKWRQYLQTKFGPK